MPNHTLQILRLLRFAGLMLLLGSVASASAQTVGERLKKDPDFRIYAVVFGVTATTNSKPPAVRLIQVGKISGQSGKSADAVMRDLPDAYIKAAKKKIQAEASKASDERWEAGRGLHLFLLRSGASQCRGH